MVQLKIVSGNQAGYTSVARRFPFQVGRAADSGLVIQEPGVWDRHFVIEFEPGNGFIATPLGDALMTVNGDPTQGIRLRNGDSIEIGGVRLRFWLADTRQPAIFLRDWLVWGGIALVTVAQVVLIYRLIR